MCIRTKHVPCVRERQKRACTGGEPAAGARVGVHQALVSTGSTEMSEPHGCDTREQRVCGAHPDAVQGGKSKDCACGEQHGSQSGG